MPLIIGITGSIASGKSTACQYLQSRGAIHCDADKLVHRMYDPGKPA
ncbi:MAG: dephospho-CoA kinase, partial [Chloroflexota bacterium]|nr:dephospho-CoA kinase [Chloroflexota bacterium]